MKDEIQAGLKNAIERGFTLDEAIKSFISAGYNPVEVKEAANSIGSEITPIVQQNKKPGANSAVNAITGEQMSGEVMKSFTSSSPFSGFSGSKQNQTKSQAVPKAGVNPAGQIQPKGKSKIWVILLSVLLVILIGAIVSLTFFSDFILQTFFGK